MKRIGICFCVLFISVLLFVSCTDSADDGVVIIPSSRGEAVITETSAVTDAVITAESVSEETVSDETEAVTEAVTVAVSDETDVLEKAEALLNDKAFLAYLDQYGVDAVNGDVLGAVAAMLAYRDDEAMASADSDGTTESAVYWTNGGSVWHITQECSALAKSKNISSGSVAEALATGKARACKRCAE